MTHIKRLAVAVMAATLALSALAAPASANWPVRTTNSRVSQWSHSGHRAIDVAAPYGSVVQAMRQGTTVFAGWRNNCGGRQVYVYQGKGSDGRSRYAAYYHLSRINTYRGERLSTGESLGRVGTSGCTTGPHVHVEMWSGYPWRSGSYRINPWWYMKSSFYGVKNSYLPYRYR